MAQPTTVHIASATGARVSVALGRQSFIHDQVFPVVPVMKSSDYFYKLLKGAWFRLEAGKRGPGGKARESGYNWTTDSYSCKEIALAHLVPKENIENADDPLRPIDDGIAFCENAVLLNIEKQVSDLVVTAGNWTGSEDVEGGWAATDSTNTFITDMLAAIDYILIRTGFRPNRLEISGNTFRKLKEASVILDRIKYGGSQGKPADVSADALASLFELEKVVIGDTIYSNAEEIQAGTDFNAVRLWETNATKGGAFLYYSPPTPGHRIPASGYVFDWENGAEAEEGVQVEQRGNVTVRSWWEKDRHSRKVEASRRVDVKAVAADAGYCFYDTITT